MHFWRSALTRSPCAFLSRTARNGGAVLHDARGAWLSKPEEGGRGEGGTRDVARREEGGKEGERRGRGREGRRDGGKEGGIEKVKKMREKDEEKEREVRVRALHARMQERVRKHGPASARAWARTRIWRTRDATAACADTSMTCGCRRPSDGPSITPATPPHERFDSGVSIFFSTSARRRLRGVRTRFEPPVLWAPGRRSRAHAARHEHQRTLQGTAGRGRRRTAGFAAVRSSRRASRATLTRRRRRSASSPPPSSPASAAPSPPPPSSPGPSPPLLAAAAAAAALCTSMVAEKRKAWRTCRWAAGRRYARDGWQGLAAKGHPALSAEEIR